MISWYPEWVDTTIYHTADEVRSMPRVVHAKSRCYVCKGSPTPPTYRYQGAHLVPGGHGLKRKGPMVLLCSDCHDEMDGRRPVSDPWRIVVRRDGALVQLFESGEAREL